MLKDCLLKTLGRYSFLLSARPPGGLHPFARRLSISILRKTIRINFRKLEASGCKGKCIPCS